MITWSAVSGIGNAETAASGAVHDRSYNYFPICTPGLKMGVNPCKYDFHFLCLGEPGYRVTGKIIPWN